MFSDNTKASNEYTQEQILDCLYDKLYRCPCCDAEFYNRTVDESKIKYCGTDTDLRRYYEPVDPIVYDVVCCTNCGYSSLAKTFDDLPFRKAQMVAAEITPRLKNKQFPQIFTYDIAVLRYRAALLTAMVAREKSSEIAYLYMKLAWIFRSLGDRESELQMILAAFEGFLEAIQKEFFPFIDLDEANTLYIMGEFLYRLSQDKQSCLFFNKAIAKDDISQELREKIEAHPIMAKIRLIDDDDE